MCSMTLINNNQMIFQNRQAEDNACTVVAMASIVDEIK